jgi:hypothetical protein
MILSYTLLSTWENCPHQAARRYIIKDLPFEETQAMADGKRIHQAFEERIRRKVPFHVDLQCFEKLAAPLDKVNVRPEVKLGVTRTGMPCDFFDPNVWLRGVLDAPFTLTTDTAILLDWKNGKPRENPFELEIGALLLQAHDPILTRLYGRYVWLKEMRHGKTHDLSDTRRTWAKVNALAKEVEYAQGVGTYPKTKNALCGWCVVRDCQHNRTVGHA